MENMEFLKAMLAELKANMKANQEKAEAYTESMHENWTATLKQCKKNERNQRGHDHQ
jgi:hypothetical protein